MFLDKKQIYFYLECEKKRTCKISFIIKKAVSMIKKNDLKIFVEGTMYKTIFFRIFLIKFNLLKNCKSNL